MNMRKIIVAVLTGVLISVGGVSLISSPAAAANRTPGCVTKAEWRKVDVGMHHSQVNRIFGTKGKTYYTTGSGRYKDTYRSYRACRPFNKYSYLEINFFGGYVYSKTSYWTRNSAY